LGKFPSALIVALLVAIAIVAYSKFPLFHPANTATVANSPAKPQTISGRASVIDGDTIQIHGIQIRLFGIDAPESGQTCTVQGKAYRCGQRAANVLDGKIRGQVVECRPKDQDRYGRNVAVCFVGGEDINGWMVAQGWALAYRYYSLDYVDQEKIASNSKLGLWQGEFEPGWDWRRDHPQGTSSRGPQNKFSQPRRGEPRHVIYYRPGERTGTRYQTICEQAWQRAGNVGVCVMK
jgi:endonuclease YncB( thermonuclease family)